MTLGRFEGVNAGYVLELYERFRQNPESVDPATRAAFEGWNPAELEPGTGEPLSAPTSANVHAVVAATILADSIRRYGHLAAQLDPLGSTPIGDPSLSPATYGITDDDLKRLPASLVGGPVAETSSTAFEAIEKLRRVYCSSTGFDYSHIFVPEERDWLRHAAESGRFLPPLDPASTEALLDRITQVEVFERFLQRTFPGKTRFSVEGLDMLRARPRRDHLGRGRYRSTSRRDRHGAPRSPERARAHPREAVRADPRRVQGSGARRAASRRPRMDGRREVSRRRAHREPARAHVRDDAPESESPGSGESGRRGNGACGGHLRRSSLARRASAARRRCRC